MDVCRHADGTPASTDGWTPVVSDDNPASNIVANSCAQGGHIDLALGAGSHGKAGGPASVLLTGPPGIQWTKLQAWLAYTSSPTTAAQDPAHKVTATVAGSPLCSWGTGGAGCSTFGSFNAAPLADVNRVTVTASAPGQPLAMGVMCDSSPGQCPATGNEPYAHMRVWRIAVTVLNSEPPTVPADHDTGQPAPGVAVPGHVHNGSGKASKGRLTARLRRDRKGRLHLSGRLVDWKRRPISNASLVVKRTPGMAVRVLTGRDGRYHRVLGQGQRVVVRWYPWADSQAHLTAKGKKR